MLIKDFRILKNQGKTLLLMLLIVAVFMNLITDVGPSLIVGYITILFSMFTATTVSYDEFDNCYLFLMTLPVTRKKYVNEKYLFALLSIIFAWCTGIVFGAVLLIAQPSAEVDSADWLVTCAGYIFTAWIFVSVMLPIRLKFDAEKARYANLVMLAGVFIVAFLAKDLFFGPGTAGFPGLFAGITAVVVIISYMCSQHIMAKKEF